LRGTVAGTKFRKIGEATAPTLAIPGENIAIAAGDVRSTAPWVMYRPPAADTGARSPHHQEASCATPSIRRLKNSAGGNLRQTPPRCSNVRARQPEFGVTIGTNFALQDPLQAEDIRDTIVYLVTRPHRAAMNEILVRLTERDR